MAKKTTTDAVTETADTGPTAADVRAWAREAGLEVGARGRIHPSVIEAYNKGRKLGKRYVRPEEAPRARRVRDEELVSA